MQAGANMFVTRAGRRTCESPAVENFFVRLAHSRIVAALGERRPNSGGHRPPLQQNFTKKFFCLRAFVLLHLPRTTGTAGVSSAFLDDKHLSRSENLLLSGERLCLKKKNNRCGW